MSPLYLRLAVPRRASGFGFANPGAFSLSFNLSLPLLRALPAEVAIPLGQLLGLNPTFAVGTRIPVAILVTVPIGTRSP